MTNTIPPATATQHGQRTAKKKTKNQTARMEALTKIARANVEKYNTVKNTCKAYSGNIKRTKEFLHKQVADRKSRGITVCELGIPTDELEKALDNPPNQYSAMVVEMFITQKCFHEKCKKGVAEGIHAAFCDYWDEMDGDKYAGEYKLDETTKQVTGCPARAPCVLAVKKAVQIRGKADSATRQHAEALSIEDEQKLMRWSQMVCPDELLEKIRSKRAADGSSRPFKEGDDGEEEAVTVDELLFLFEHGFMRAFVPSAFTLWTRCFELLSLTVGDITQNCRGRAPYYTPHFKVHLEHRKGWQNAHGYDGPRSSNTYEIYQQDIPEIDMYMHLPRWLALYEALLGRELEPEDQIFPNISMNGTIHPREEMSYDGFMKMLRKFTSGAELDGWFTTHSFRRGGAQYRFIFAPASARWSLNKVRWWGGWAENESVDTLMKYLLDSLQSYENGHGDALHPVPSGFSESFLGEHVEAAPVTAREVRELKRSVDEKMDSIDQKMENVVSRITSTLAATHLPTIRPTLPLSASGPARAERVVHAARAASAPYPPRSASVGSSNSESLSTTSTGDPDSFVAQTQQKGCRPAPIQGVRIPRLKAGPKAWKHAVEQWEDGDPNSGFLALKDWPLIWYTDDMRTITAAARHDRELVAIAYNRVGRDDNTFLATYPEALKCMRDLLPAIRRNLGIAKPRKSRNGTPEEREAKRRAALE